MLLIFEAYAGEQELGSGLYHNLVLSVEVGNDSVPLGIHYTGADERQTVIRGTDCSADSNLCLCLDDRAYRRQQQHDKTMLQSYHQLLYYQ